MKRVVITGVGACTSVGESADEFFSSILKGQQGNKPLVHLDATRFNTQVAYEREQVGEHNGKTRSSDFLLSALNEAVADAGLSDTASEFPVYIGTGLRELRTLEVAALANETLDVEQLDYTNAVQSILPQCKDIYTISNACAASNYALALACDSIQLGHTDIAVAAGCDTITASMFGLLDRVNPNSPEAVKVFDETRQGVLMGDGGVAIIIESLASAIKNKRTPLAEIKSVGLSSDAVHETAPDQAGITRALQDAYSQANISPEDVDLIYVHGTGTELNDKTESAVLAATYQQANKRPAISGIKSMIGHTSGASGGIGVVAAVKSLQQQVIPPTPGTTKPITDIKAFPIYAQVQKSDLALVQVNAFGFGGVNTVVLVAQFEGECNE